jgi:hypothetical protein
MPAGRKTHFPFLHEISVQIGPNSGAGGLIGVLPAGSIMGNIHNVISQAFNSTTNTGGVGTLPPPSGANLQGGIDLTVPIRSDNLMPAGVCGPLGVDTPIYWTAAFTGPAPTQGVWTVWIDFLPGAG